MTLHLPPDETVNSASAGQQVIYARFILLGSVFFLPYIALIPVWGSSGNGLFILDGQRLFQCITLVLELLIFARIGFEKPPVISARILMVWLALGSLGLLTVAFSTRPTIAILDWAWINALAVAVLLTSFLFRADRPAMRHAILLSVFFTALLYVFWFFVGNSDYLFSYDFRFTEPTVFGFANSRYFSDFQAALLFLLPVASLAILPKSRWRWAASLLIGLMFALAFHVGARSVLLGQILAHCILLLVLGKRYLPFLKRIVAFWVLGGGLYVALFVVLSPENQQEPMLQAASQPVVWRQGSSGRDQLFAKTWRLIAQNPLLGVGGRHFGCYVAEDLLGPRGRFEGDNAHPHNALAQLAAEWGIGQTTLLAGLVLFLLERLRRSLREQKSTDDFDLAMAGSLLALLAHAQVAGVINGPVSQGILVLLAGWAVQRSCLSSDGPEIRISGSSSLPWLAVGLALLISVLFARELASVPQMNSLEFNKKSPTSYFSPRFWQQGWLLPLCGKI